MESEGLNEHLHCMSGHRQASRGEAQDSEARAGPVAAAFWWGGGGGGGGDAPWHMEAPRPAIKPVPQQ